MSGPGHYCNVSPVAQIAGLRGELKDVETARLIADRAAGVCARHRLTT